jgi:hypothetical protein
MECARIHLHDALRDAVVAQMAYARSPVSTFWLAQQCDELGRDAKKVPPC